MAYCTKGDLLLGDIPMPSRYGDGTRFVNMAADEIDGQIGHIYVTPIMIPSVPSPELRPAQLLLKKINFLLASGRIILDMAAGGEDESLHAYGRSMWNEATRLLNQIANGTIELIGIPKLDDEGTANNGPSVVNEDSESLVEAFYSRGQTPSTFPHRPIEFYRRGN